MFIVRGYEVVVLQFACDFLVVSVGLVLGSFLGADFQRINIGCSTITSVWHCPKNEN